MYRIEKDTGDIVIDGFEQGVAPSPHKGIANMQNVNIATETGEVMNSFGRVAQQQAAITNGTLTASVSDGAVLLDAPSNLNAGDWITVSASTISAATATTSYLMVGGGGGGGGATASNASGGGGAGGVVTGSFTPSVGTSYAVTVGTGGAGGAAGSNGTDGQNTTVSNLAPTTLSASLLVVGGGGGGGGGDGSSNAGTNAGGGGGAGAVKTSSPSLAFGKYTITVGGGGAGGTSGGKGTSGSSSSFGSVLSGAGGGGGGGVTAVAGVVDGASGASGGGGGASASQGNGGTATDGNAGGNGAGGSPEKGGGGGGASQAGNTGGQMVGGNGTASSITGSSVTYGGGGGGAASSGGAGAGGSGGGGVGGNNAAGTNGTANTGGGGGGGSGNAHNGGDGGSGIVVLRFTPVTLVNYNQTGGTVTTSGGDTIITWTSSGTFTLGTALGGGGGAAPGTDADGGGSGGGASNGHSAGTGVSGQGNAGGTSGATSNAGGGGGAGAVGSNGSGTTGGAGGNGTASSISGTSITYGGGGGAGGSATGGAGGTGGGGAGIVSTSADTAVFAYGVNGLGGGGGGNYGDFGGGRGGSGVVIFSYATGTMTAKGGTVTFSGGNTIHTFYGSGTFVVQSIAAAAQYYVSYKNTSNKIKLSATYDPYALNPIAHGTSGTATFSTLTTVNQALAKATEKYSTSTTTEYRYYILDANGYVWVYDTAVYSASLAASGVGTLWMLPDPTDYSAQAFTGIAVLNGELIILSNTQIKGKSTAVLGAAFTALDNAFLTNPFATHNNFALSSHQGRMYYCDGNYIGSLFADTSVVSGAGANIQSFATYTVSGTDPSAGSTITVSSLIEGSLPFALNSSGSILRIPVVFFPDQNGTQPAGLTAQTVYFLQGSVSTGNFTFQVYTTSTGGSPLTFSASGTQYFNTFYPFGSDAGIYGNNALAFFSPQRVTLPEFEVAQNLVEVGNSVLIGCQGSVVYPWNQIDVTPSGLINLPEANVQAMVTVNQMAYIFAGSKGNIYISDGSTASLVMKVPDYCAGIAGTPNSYVEPYFSWGDGMYVRGRVYFSILDQTAAKTGNCGGVWSFIPTQNLYLAADTGLSLKLENQNSYGTYNGVATILIPAAGQAHISTQYWAAWYSSISAPTYGIDFTDTVPAVTATIDTDIIPTGTMLQKRTFKQIEYKLATPQANGESIAISWRQNRTDSFTSAGSANTETSPLSGYFTVNFEKGQWLQLRVTTTSLATSSGTFLPIKEIRVR